MRRLSLSTALAGYGVLLIALRPHWAEQGFWTYWSQDPERALVALAALAGWALAAWLFIATALAVAAQAPSAIGRMASRTARLVTPRAARHLLEAALGVVLAVGPAGAALAGPAVSSQTAISVALAPVPAPIIAEAEPLFPDLDRPFLQVPAATVSAAPTTASPPTTSVPSPTRTAIPAVTAPVPYSAPAAGHTVVPGDTLWGLAAAASPPGASPAAITALWQQWYAANRTTIGSDPDLLLPGQMLAAPVAS